ncbi:TonB-dependent receptor [Brevundimonas sp.]|uniref:TonB-dependent receptor n=1 Tax=Brevundimonas sp. TaxID=1871086 RepID=UPI00273113A6|nr:TonB-dependent receptor [Brevundimonas sp.]MDP1912572.1 TonB-dependent receptor [Brevundimonas sp.]
MTNRKRVFWASTALLTTLVSATAVYAQETTASVRGQLVTAGGAPIGGAAITLVHQPSGTTLNTVSDGSGTFDARGLRVGGPYLITVQAEGYASEAIDNVFLTVAETTRLTIDLESVAALDDVIVTAVRDVTANNTGVSSVLDREGVESVVSVNRDIRDLARRNILVSQNTRGDGGISIAGSNPRTNRITIDGVQAQDDFGLNTGGTPTRRGPISLDAIEQFAVSAVPIDVENGDFQGGALDVVLRSGNNDFQGSAFVNYLNDGMVGDSIDGVEIPSAITQNNYGAFISGPIWRDRLFFALSYELYETADQTQTGPTGAGYANEIRGLTQANIDAIINSFNTLYATDFDTGNIVRTKPITDEKYSAKLDWNITDNHRLALTYRNANSQLFQRTNLSTSSAGLDSQWYLTGEDDQAYAGELNSRWSDSFSTQFRVSLRDYERVQNPPSGQEFADITICSAPTSINSGGDTLTGCGANSVVRFGPDQFRHANFLTTENLQVQAKGEYSLGDNLFKFGYQGQFVDVFNIFVPSSDGVYYFDSVADFQAGRANRLFYNNSVTGTATDAAAAFAYEVHSLFAQDTLQLFDNFSLTAGFRYDFYRSDDEPALNPNFVARNGFDNQTTYDGIDILMPRVSFDWEATDWLNVKGGLGLFSGGIPDVFLSNSFSNTGVFTSSVAIERLANGTFRETTGAPGFTQAIGADALNINLANARFGYDIPASVEALLGGAVVSPFSETNALIPNFQIPADWKSYLSATVRAPQGWASSFTPEMVSGLLDDWRLSLDAVFTKVDTGLSFRDFRAQELIINGVQQLTPDGRIRYDGLNLTAAQRAAQGISSQNGGSSRDIVAINTDEGEGYTIGLSAFRSFDNGLDILLGYARQNVEDRVSGARFGSTASSLYGSGAAGLDPNEEAYGTSFEEIQNRWKAEIGYSRYFFGDLETRFNLFGEIRDGRPISFVMSDATSGRGATFGVNRGNYLFYVPDFANDADPTDLNVGIVTFDSAATRDNVRNLVETFGLEQGTILGKGQGSDDQPEIYQIDLQFSQDLPSFFLPGKFRLVADLQNVANLLNDEWGIIEEYSDTVRVVSAGCANAAGVASGTSSAVCDRYRYTNYNTGALTRTRDNNGKSLWAVQVSLRYQF